MNKKVLIIGNLGYIGCVLNKYLCNNHIDVFGLDANWFGEKYIINDQKKYTKKQIIGDIRNEISKKDMWSENYDAVVYLAAVSNDPMGKRFSNVTHEINGEYCLNVATEAKKRGIKKFIFASSCSMYGIADKNFPNENSELSPMTEYAKSKVWAEKELKKISTSEFNVISLRFATACGASPKLRLDLVLNDLVASAIINQHVEVLSDGTPWRPLVHVEDMSRTIKWSIDYNSEKNFLPINIGSKEFTYQIKDFAKMVVESIPNTTLSIATDKAVDSRSYKVDFSLFEKVSGKSYYPKFDAKRTILDLTECIKNLNIPNNFRKSNNWMRLKHLEKNISLKIMDEKLYKLN